MTSIYAVEQSYAFVYAKRSESKSTKKNAIAVTEIGGMHYFYLFSVK